MHLKIDWASLIPGKKFTVFLCFTWYWRGISKYKPPGGAYIWRGDLTEGFLRWECGGLIFGRGLYMEGLIFGILWYNYTEVFAGEKADNWLICQGWE